MSLLVVTHPDCAGHAREGGGHPERPDRLEAALAGTELVPGVERAEADPLDAEALARVHDPEHVRAVERAAREGRWLDNDTYAGEGSWRAARLAAGAAVQAARSTADGRPAFAIVRPPGHHAERAKAMGFCLFNSVALAADALAREGHQVAVVDLDVHHGNGTQAIFEDRDDVLYASIHQSPFYPGTGLAHETGTGPGEGYTVNLPVPEGTGHAGWVELVERVLVPVLESFDPDAVLLSAGVDAHRRDPIGGLELGSDAFHQATRAIAELTPPTGAVLEGGYSLDALRSGTAATGAALVGEDNPRPESITQGVRPWGMLESDVRAHHGDRWPVPAERGDLRLGTD